MWRMSPCSCWKRRDRKEKEEGASPLFSTVFRHSMMDYLGNNLYNLDFE
jgi:hypothetical protein